MPDWTPPPELPDLRNVGLLALDTEGRDGGLQTDHGSAWPWGDGHVCGLSIAYREAGVIRAYYFPIRHPDSQNFDREQVRSWLRDLFLLSSTRIVTHHGLYDYGWLWADFGLDMPPADRIEETEALATIVNENQHSYRLDDLCRWRKVPGKDETLLRESCYALGLVPKRVKKFNPKTFIWQLPAHLAGPYAEQDAVSTLLLYESLAPVLDREGTHAAYRLECDLLPMVHQMRRRGIRVDRAAAERAQALLRPRRDALLTQIGDLLGTAITMKNIRSRNWLVATFDRLGISYPRTPKGNPSFKRKRVGGWMKASSHPLPPLIAAAYDLDHYAEYFIGTQILGHMRDGRVHAEINPHRGESGGTHSFRFSYAHPPLQQMPKHDEELAPLVRAILLPEDGEVWASCDISQQEFRFIVHYAVRKKLPRAQEAADRYRNDPDTDFHLLVSEWTGIERQLAKNANFARSYGAGVKKFAEMIGKSEAEARIIWDKYNRELPFVSRLSEKCQEAVWQTGYLTLYGGARRHFNQWAPGGKWEKQAGPCEREEAERRCRDPGHPWYRKQLFRVDVRNAMNALIQGSSAYHTKLWMRECYRAGVIPLLQMHDALEISIRTPEQVAPVAKLGCDVVANLEVPMKIDVKYGRTWGDAKHSWGELHTTGPHIELTVDLPDDREHAQHTSPKFSNDFDEAPDLAAHEAPNASDDLPWEDDVVLTTLNAMAEAPIAAPARVNGGGFDDFTADVQGYDNSKINCPFHEDKTPSCQLYADGHYHCFGCGAHGWIAEDMDLPDNVLARVTETKDDTRTLERGLELWAEAKPITGTLAERYLIDTRKLDLAALPNGIDAALRFHSRCPFGANGTRHPCLLALFRDVESDAPAGIHRIGLTPDANKIRRLTLGRWPNPRAIKLWPVTHKLTIGEGIETVLGAMRCGAITPPAWAMGPKADIAKFPVLPGTKALTVLVDRGDPAALDGAEACAARYVAADIPVRWLRTVRVKDFNDLVLA